LKQAKKDEENQYVTMKKRIKYMYENGNTSYIEIILDAGSLSDMLNRAEYIEKVMKYDKNMLNTYQDTKQKVIDKESELEERIQKLNDLTEEVEYEKQTVETLVDDKTAEVEKYNDKIASSEGQVSEFNNEIEEQEALIEELLEAERKRVEEEERRKKEEEKRRKEEEERKKQEQQQQQQQDQQNNNSSNSNNTSNNSDDSDSSNDSDNTGSSTSFTWPCPGSHTITSSFGYRNSPTAGASSYHQGIDIGAPSGTSIVAAGSGTVVTASYSGAAGNFIMISHGNGVFTVYMHCSQLLVSVGDSVSKGQKIGLVGSTGISTGPHLHFGVSVNGSYVNPLNYVN
jgi:murein DD-endopeptidase MepM/ murein hydrolase activator NlpD